LPAEEWEEGRGEGAAFLTTPIPLWDPQGGLGRRF
jgi:hypothetical protein